MTRQKQDDPLTRQIKQELDAGLDRLDPAIAARLQESRSKALEQTTRRPFWEWLLGHPRQLAGFATAALLLVLVVHWNPLHPVTPENRIEEMELVAQQGSLDMYKDLDFYAWLAKADQ